ncbi:MAG: phosphoribosylformylglycinamidine synthase subunit PurQ [Flavobacteriales bacterium]|jgi:phosphoribosylformylglycinamidine synthase subunit PurQ / glutaminase|nr:phosphoribosylformylglycinamidine synthase subunit PurQ [Flavobacteriales bacterium]
MKIGVVTFPGSNCNMDIVHALRNNLKYEVVELWHKDSDLQDVEAVVLPGGFSYGDYLRSGAIARFSPIMEEVIKYARDGGKVLGICNGFQILCEAGLLPGTLMHNESRKFICKNVYLLPVSRTASISSDLDDKAALKIPIAHGEGNYFLQETELAELESNDQVIFRYCDENGKVSNSSNPNGSANNIAGVCNEGKNVFGMMPHPERACSEDLGNTDGLAILRGLETLVKA